MKSRAGHKEASVYGQGGIVVSLFRDHPAEGWPSMERYADGVEGGLRLLSPPRFHITSRTPPDPWAIPRGLLLWRVFVYPVWSRQRQGDVNHVLDHSYGNLLFALDPTRTVVTVHDIAPLLFPGRRLGLSRLVWRWAWKGTLRARYLITDSEFTRRILVERCRVPPGRIVVVPLGVEPSFHPLSREDVARFRRRYGFPNVPILLHVGHTQPRKNLEGLLRALAIAREQIPNLILLQAGGRPTARQLRLIESLQLQEAVFFLGYVPNQDLVGLYNLADLFVFPSLYEGFGFPPLEAMACGTPVVASNAASLPEVVGDAGLLVDPKNPGSIAEGIIRVLRDADLVEDLRRRGLERARQFSWKRTAERVLAVYQAVLQG